MASVNRAALTRKVAGEAMKRKKQTPSRKRASNCHLRLVTPAPPNVKVNRFAGAQSDYGSGTSLHSPPRPLSNVHGKER